jgi:ribosomal protein S8
MTFVNAPIHDLLIRIKNAYKARKIHVLDVQFSNFKQQVCDLLKEYKFISGYEIREEGKKQFIDITLNKVISTNDDVPVVKFYSTPSRPWYISYKEIRSVAGGKGIGIIATSK